MVAGYLVRSERHLVANTSRTNSVRPATIARHRQGTATGRLNDANTRAPAAQHIRFKCANNMLAAAARPFQGSMLAGQSSVGTEQYTFIEIEHQDQLTRAIQEPLALSAAANPEVLWLPS